MQLYSGLPVITNKIQVEERQGIPHHLLGCIGLREQTWVVGTFARKALGVIEEIRSRGRVPILVGGTHYYLQSLLFKDKLAESESGQQERPFVEDTGEKWPILRQDTPAILEELKKVDPVMADRWHPNDRRKIQRSLEIYLQTGKRASEIYAEQRHDKSASAESNDAKDDGPSLRFPTLIFWIHSESETLNRRLEKRVDKMLANGLLDEVRTLDAFANDETAGGRAVDETRGIWVSIGYKEFKGYMQALQSDQATEKELIKSKEEALERTSIATRQYAKRQVRWIRIKLVNALAEAKAGGSLYLLDGSDVAAFDSHVVEPASNLTRSFLNATSPLPDPKSLSSAAAEMLSPKRDYDLSAQPEKWTKRYCEVCDVTCVTEDQWSMHVKSKAHRKLTAKQKRLADEEGIVKMPPGG